MGSSLHAGVTTLVILFRKVNRSESEKGQVEGVQPDDGGIALVAVVVPMPDGRDDYITSPKRHLLSLDGSEALSINDESEGESNVSVSWCRFSRIHDLKTTVDGVSGVRRFYNV